MVISIKSKKPHGVRVIKTARDLDSINKAAKSGFKPLIKRVEPSKEIISKYSVVQNKKTGEIEMIIDYRRGFDYDGNNDFETVIGWTHYYPYSFKSPFAAYLIPGDIKIGERVFVEDLIEDYVGVSWNQGDAFRLEGCEAVWNGSDLQILYDPRVYRSDVVG